MKRLFPILLALICSGAFAESGTYRVEVIIFRNLATIPAPTGIDIAVDALRNFSQFPALEESNLPDDLHVVTTKSSRMDGVWRRLRNSKNYHPLLYTSWEQNRIEYYPPMHIHDGTIIESRLRSPLIRVSTEPVTYDLPVPEQNIFYQLDGAIQLRRSRFLHLDIDLEFRADPDELSTPNTNSGRLKKVYILKQSRQVRRSQLQYFDTPYFAVLVLVSAVSSR